MSSVIATLATDACDHQPGSEVIELSADEIDGVSGGWLPLAGLVLGVAGRALGGWSGAFVNRVGYGVAVFETARWLGGGGSEQYGNSGSPRE